MLIVNLCFLGFFLNSANSSGKYDNITIEEIQDEIKKGSIFTYLDETLKRDIDLSIITSDEKRELVNEWRVFADVIDQPLRLNTRVDKGLNLLVAYLFEGIQSRVEPDLNIPSICADVSQIYPPIAQ